MRAQSIDWDRYLEAFHTRSPGITEQVLTRCHDHGVTPYDWLLDGVDPNACIVDVGCGSGPARPAGAARWVGVDRSAAELHAAQQAARSAVVLGDATRLPVADGAADVVVCSLSLMLVHPLDAALVEIRRVLGRRGQLRLLLPARAPLTVIDRWRYAQLFWSARSTTQFPPTRLRRDAAAVLVGHGLAVEADDTRRFSLRLDEPADADRFVDSWYLPGVDPDRRAAARRRARTMVPVEIGVPLRRVSAQTVGMPGAGHGVPRP